MQNKPVTLVTGANKGIGLQIALALLDADGPTGTFSDEGGPLPW